MDKLYYYAENGNPVGPLTLEELKAKSSLTRETLVWYEGLGEWQKADMLDELSECFIKSGVPPPVPKTSPPLPPPLSSSKPPEIVNKNNARAEKEKFYGRLAESASEERDEDGIRAFRASDTSSVKRNKRTLIIVASIIGILCVIVGLGITYAIYQSEKERRLANIAARESIYTEPPANTYTPPPPTQKFQEPTPTYTTPAAPRPGRLLETTNDRCSAHTIKFQVQNGWVAVNKGESTGYLQVAQSTVYWDCSGTTERTICPGGTRFIRVTRDWNSRAFTCYCYN